MNLALFSIKRPIFISSIITLIIFTGWISLSRLGVDLFPDVNIPVVTVNTVYRGAGPEEIETLISKPIEEELSSISGLKKLTSRNQEGFSLVVAEFHLSTDIKDAEQQVRNKVARTRRLLPSDIEEPLIIRFDPADQPVIRYSLFADLPPAELYELAKEEIKPQIEQVNNVGAVKLIGGVKREIQIELDRNKLNQYQMASVLLTNQLKNYGMNVPLGKHESGTKETSFRTLGRFESTSQIENALVYFGGEFGNAISVKMLGRVIDGTEDPTSICYLYAPFESKDKKQTTESTSIFDKIKNRNQPEEKIDRTTKTALFIDVMKQSGTNTIKVVDDVKVKIDKINANISNKKGSPRLSLVRDGSVWIKKNVGDVTESIIIGIILTVIVVYFFLGNVRSTIITGLALPNSLLGAFVIMYVMDFTINIMTLLALSISVGLLVDDAIVVRENIFRKLEEGMSPARAAEEGTNEVALAVIATSATVIAVFFPVGFLSGIVGQFFKQFGLTVVFAMLVSLFDALTIAPMLSAYFAGNVHAKPNRVIIAFNKFQSWLERMYGYVMKFCLRFPWLVLISTIIIFVMSILSLKFVKKTFLPPSDQGEFLVSLELPPDYSLSGTEKVVKDVQQKLMSILEVDKLAIVVGNTEGQSNVASIGVALVDSSKRKKDTTQVKEDTRKIMKEFQFAKPSVDDYSMVGGGVQYPFNLSIMGDDLKALDEFSAKLVQQLKTIPDLIDVEREFQTGKPEFQIKFDPAELQSVGVTPVIAGMELRNHVAGSIIGKLYDKGLEYDIRMRLKADQRNLQSAYKETRVPNTSFRMIPLSAISKGFEAEGPVKIIRQNRSRVIQIHANLSANGAVGNATDAAVKILTGELKPPTGIRYVFFGQAEDMKELFENIILAFGIALLFIYLVLASLYESFITPISILVAIPPAISGAFFALAIFKDTLNIFSMIGIILLMGLVTKNSILLVDYAVMEIGKGVSRNDAIYKAGLLRLRPILMTSLAMIAGTLPIALGLGEIGKQRTAMGIAIIGGLIVSTVLSLVVVPAIFGYVDIFREWLESKFRNQYEEKKIEKISVVDDLEMIDPDK